MASPVDIVVVGSHAPGLFLKVKRVPRVGETVIGWDFQEPIDGGKGSNQAIAAARLGAKTSFVGCVGSDRLGDAAIEWLQGANVDITWLKRHGTVASGIGFIMLAEDGVPAMVTSMGANAELTTEYIEQALNAFRSSRVMLVQFEIPVEVALHAASVARRLGMVSIVNPAPSPEEEIRGLDAASILVPNEAEAGALLGSAANAELTMKERAVLLRQKTGALAVIITLGSQGAVGVDQEGVWHSPAPDVDAVDTSGAGDVFCAALAVGLANGVKLRDASYWACQVAAISVTRPGTIPSFPTLNEVPCLSSH